jgi:predicted nucleic acid-binding protein
MAILTDFSNDRVSLIAPAHLQYEVSNAIRTAVHRQRLPSQSGLDAIERFLALPIALITGEALILTGYALALQYQCAFYDGLYLALADQADCPLVHADRRSRNTLGGRFSRDLWIEDYVS